MSPAIGVISAASHKSIDIVPEHCFGLVEHSSNLTIQGGKPLANTTDTIERLGQRPKFIFLCG